MEASTWATLRHGEPYRYGLHPVRSIVTAQVMEELIAMAKMFKEVANRGEDLGLYTRNGEGPLLSHIRERD